MHQTPVDVPVSEALPRIGVRVPAGLLARVGSGLLVIATGVLAALPVISSTVKAVRDGWVPAGDDGIIATRGWDVLSSHTPLIGQYSEAGLVVHGQVMHSPGPMLYWLLALPARHGSVASLAVTMCVFNTLAIVLCVALARRRGGLVLMFAAALGIALMSQSLPGEAMHDIWNPAAGLFAFLALIFVGWSLACGDYWLLPLAALLASFVVQTHLMYLAPSAVVLGVGAGGLALRWLGWRRARGGRAGDGRGGAQPADGVGAPASRGSSGLGAPASPGWTGPAAPATLAAAASVPVAVRPRRIWPWSLAAVLVLVACWTAPAIEQFQANPGNLTMIARTVEHRGHTLGDTVGWHALVRAIGQRPWWLYVPASEWERKYDVHATPSHAQSDSALALLIGLGVVLLVGALRRRWDLFAAALIALSLCAVMVLQVADNPSSRLLSETLGYTLWWGSELGFWVWLVLSWALWLAVVGLVRVLRTRTPPLGCVRALPRGVRAPRGVRPGALVLVSLACLAALAAVGRAVAGHLKPDSHVYEYRAISATAAGIERLVASGQTIDYRFGPLDIGTQPMEPGLRFQLVRHGDRVLANGSFPRLGSYYVLGDRPYGWVVYLRDGTRAQPHMRLASRVSFRSPWGREVLSAWVCRVPAPTTKPRRRA